MPRIRKAIQAAVIRVWKIGIYIRLSREDKEKEEERVRQKDHRRMKASFDEKADALRAALENIKDEINTLARGVNSDDPFLATFLKHRNITEINRGIVVELIDTIYLHEDGQITIDFSFADELKRVLEFVENNRNDLIVMSNEAVS